MYKYALFSPEGTGLKCGQGIPARVMAHRSRDPLKPKMPSGITLANLGLFLAK
jgi:hypothetical protein